MDDPSSSNDPDQSNRTYALFQRGDRIVQEARFVLSSIPNVDEASILRSLHQLEALDNALATLVDPYMLPEEVNALRDMVHSLMCDLQSVLDEPPQRRTASVNTPSGQRGRPRQQLDLDRARELHDLGASWEQVASAMGTTRQTIYNHLADAGLSSSRPVHSQLSDDELDEEVAQISLNHPLAGAAMIHGQLFSKGINVPIERVRESLRRVDAIGVLLRWSGVIKRRVYKVRGSNALWHMDGNEKLRPWGFYVHGCVDGHSRLIIYLRCSNNKRAHTVESIFLGGVEMYGWPSRMRGDFGTENNRVEVLMIAHWGEFHRAYLRGRSIHNVRIERLWRDVRRHALEFFRQIFIHLEECGLLNMELPHQRIALYLVFEPRIQKMLDDTVTSWNFHKVRTAGNRSPMALYELSRQEAITQGYWTGDPGDDLGGVDELYGVDGQAAQDQEDDEEQEEHGADASALGPEPEGTIDEERAAGLFVNEDEELDHARDILSEYDLTRDDDNNGIDVYCEAALHLQTVYDV